jgi:hypothetical protein
MQRMASSFDFFTAMNFSITSYEQQVMKPVLHFWKFKPKSSQSSGCTHSPNKAQKFEQTLSAYQKADGISFLVQETSADSGIYATRDCNNLTSVLRNTKKNAYGQPFRTKGVEC